MKQRGLLFWLSVLTDFKTRGVEDILIACTDNLTGFTKVTAEVFPLAVTQLSIVHQIWNSCKYVSWKEIKAFTTDLKGIYGVVNRESVGYALNDFGEKCGRKYGYAPASWENNWEALPITSTFHWKSVSSFTPPMSMKVSIAESENSPKQKVFFLMIRLP